MNTPMRYVLLALFLIISIHYILSFSHEAYGRATSISRITSWATGTDDVSIQPVSTTYYSSDGDPVAPGPRQNATFVVLCRESDLQGVMGSVREAQDRFNDRYNYPWVFLNDQEFSYEFKRKLTVLIGPKSKVEFGVIPKEHWVQPDFIDEERASAARQQMEDDGIIYGGNLAYRNMCRFNSGFFFKHPLLEKYRYYWRVEPDVHFHCDVNFDPFTFMNNENKTYAFTIAMYEFEATIPTLWKEVREFTQKHPQYVADDNAIGFLSEDSGLTYNLCHFWSNFEIADMDFWRSEAYQAFFDHLESKGGFYYERWGDAPVHSIAAALFLPRKSIHFFDEIGYSHNPYTHCPRGNHGKSWVNGRCSCDARTSFDFDGYSCMRQWERIIDWEGSEVIPLPQGA